MFFKSLHFTKIKIIIKELYSKNTEHTLGAHEKVCFNVRFECRKVSAVLDVFGERVPEGGGSHGEGSAFNDIKSHFTYKSLVRVSCQH